MEGGKNSQRQRYGRKQPNAAICSPAWLFGHYHYIKKKKTGSSIIENEHLKKKDAHISVSRPEKNDLEQATEKRNSQQDMKKANELYNEIQKKQRVYSTKKIKNLQNQMIKHVRSAASMNNAKANYWLAMMYEDGFGDIKADGKQMIKYLIQAGDFGYVEAQFLLGNMYEDGDDVVKDNSKAINWHKKTAQQGLTE